MNDCFQAYLRQFAHLGDNNPDPRMQELRGDPDQQFALAISSFQRFAGLDITGRLLSSILLIYFFSFIYSFVHSFISAFSSGMVDRPKVVTHPSTNRARRSLTLLMRRTPLPLHQTSHHWRNSWTYILILSFNLLPMQVWLMMKRLKWWGCRDAEFATCRCRWEA